MNRFFGRNQRQQPSVYLLPPVVVNQYLHQWVTTTIPGYGRVIAYVADFNQNTGMVSLLVYQPPYYNQQFVQVHNTDLVGISPYFGPTPPRPGHGGGGGQGPWNPGGGHGGGGQGPWNPGGGQGGGGQGPWNPGGGQGGGGQGGLWPWIWNQIGGPRP
ncbi:hypothetical protein [Alkalicoccobacillus murimartini]|uniref:Uncharacterized protein n=1 Tax=Alkalicoccobacillus murimartini TaxID=171685 RepID=A0ABT9YJ29_9BACI|nr:hypothetical protein [Alkalicoccobacillus murimartini]MDQ0207877.1 hypothetical protein [Alkalicoccobacillus murimartini]